MNKDIADRLFMRFLHRERVDAVIKSRERLDNIVNNPNVARITVESVAKKKPPTRSEIRKTGSLLKQFPNLARIKTKDI